MKRTCFLIFLTIALCVCTIAGASAGLKVLRYELTTPPLVVSSVNIGGVIYCIDAADQAGSARAGECETCDFQLGNPAPEKDCWARYSATHHQYRIYYHATCVKCLKHAYVYRPGELGVHVWRPVGGYHAYGTTHALAEECRICGEGMTSYVFCPGPDGGGCTVVTAVEDEGVTE